MAIRRMLDDAFVVSGPREQWLERCRQALERTGFSSIQVSNVLYQVKADYKKFALWGDILITLSPEGQNTKVAARSAANIDNIFALFKNPNEAILTLFKKGLG